MRTTMHNGRGYSARHNDRNFDTSKAEHIDPERADLNVLENCYGIPELTFEEAELMFYNETFGEQLTQTNERYIRSGHPERVKTMEEWKAAKQHSPEESILQIGKMEEHADRKTLLECYRDYSGRLEKWNEEHGHPFTTISSALHADEQGAPHIHSRRVWHYVDGEIIKIGQEKALKAAGVKLPEPDKPESRRNNRKVTFDRMSRGLWLDVLREHGLEVEREPIPDGRHNRSKEQMIRDKYEALEAEAKQLRAEIDKYQSLKVEATKVELTGKPVLPGVVAVKKEKLDEVLEQARAYTYNRDDIDDLRQRRQAIREKEQLLKSRQEYLDNQIRAADARYAGQINLNREVRELRRAKSDLTKENKQLRSMVDQLKGEIEQIKSELWDKTTTLTDKVRGAYLSLTNIVKATGMLKYDKEDGYRVERLTKQQERLIDGIAEYGATWARRDGFPEMAEDMEKHIGLSKGIQEIIEPQPPKHSHAHDELEL